MMAKKTDYSLPDESAIHHGTNASKLTMWDGEESVSVHVAEVTPAHDVSAPV